MRQQTLNECDIFPCQATPQTAPPQAPSCFISCCTEDDGLSCDRGRLSLRSSSFRISHRVRLMREVLTSSIECLCLRQRHTQHLPPLHFAPLHGANLLRRIALFHFTALQVGRSAVLAAHPMAHLSIPLHFCHLAYGTRKPVARYTRKHSPNRCKHPSASHRTMCLKKIALRARGKPTHISFDVVQVRYERR